MRACSAFRREAEAVSMYNQLTMMYQLKIRMNVPCDFLVPCIGSVWFWQAIITDDNPRALFQCWNQSSQHYRAILIALVVADPSEEVHISIFDWLFGVEVVSLELDLILELSGDFRWPICNSLWQVLHNEAQLRELPCQRYTDKTMGATHLFLVSVRLGSTLWIHFA